ncbi:DUF4412 domain-containing protein [Cerasicoccus arenae]|uniref:DUF4412 domain-containing protein n=1 Tax=Cerasicoccus arenae TaxID=424488 RepID=A0A8J3DK62_9BACT|nr:DUF4412 domain-containing protein [Cerasicoccus arenae]MBK1857387.1 DUF4412 domain-containing protein [Cerasicoccus arenae]GHC09181.1 hypothetical protein GCM10007047_28080 [Cerasicoccus arenae]
MSRLISSWILLLLGASALSAFDGDIVMETTMGDQSMKTTFVAKGDKLKLAMPEGQGTLILDSKGKTMTIIMDAQKMYMVQPINPEQMGPQPDGEIQDTGETAEIFGMNARKVYFVEPDGKKSEIWATSELQNEALTNMPGMNENMVSQLEQIFGSPHVFPLKMVVFAPDGSTEMTMNVAEIKERDVADAEVTIPADYKEFSMPAGAHGQ